MVSRWSRIPAELLALGLFVALLQPGALASDDDEAQLLRQSSVGSLLSQHNRDAPPGNANPGRASEDAASGAPAQRSAPRTTGERRAGTPLREDGKTVHLFGTLELRTKIGNMPKWTAVLAKERANPGYTDNRSFPGQGTWKTLREKWGQASALDKAKAVNTLINRWPYRMDMDVWGLMDYWAAPVDFFQKSGDCEDFAIAKYFALRALGIPASQMRIVVLKDTLRNLDHAVTVIYADGEAWVLDSLSNTVLPHKRFSHYRPQFSVNEEFRWAHLVASDASARR